MECCALWGERELSGGELARAGIGRAELAVRYIASHNSFVSNSDSSAGGTSDMKYQKCKIYIVITVINRTQTNL